MPGADDTHDEPDLGALLAGLLPHLVAREEPILQQAGLSMWEYAILSALAPEAAVSQVELSHRTRRDPTRLGRHLDDLASRGVIARDRSTDQRQRTVRLTRDGDALYRGVKRLVRVVEDDLLQSALSDADATQLRRLLQQLIARLD